MRPWELTVVRAQGLRLMLPDKSWRPIVTVEVDKHAHYETLLGIDGQNPNLKNGLCCHDVQEASVVELKVWSATQSKKRRLVASATHTLGDLHHRTQTYKGSRSNAHLAEVRLSCQSLTTRSTTPSSKARPQNGATLVLKIASPKTPSDACLAGIKTQSPLESKFTTPQPSVASLSSSDRESVASQDGSRSPSPVDMIVEPATPPLMAGSPLHSGLRRRRRKSNKHIKGYVIFSDDELLEQYDSSYEGSIASGSSPSSSPRHPQSSVSFEEAICETPLDSCFDDVSETDSMALPIVTEVRKISVTRWIAASLLPQHILEMQKPEVPPYTERVEVFEPTDFRTRWWESALAAFTAYMELRDARMDSEFEAIFHRIRMEWTFVGTLLAGLAAVNTAVLSISPDSSIKLSELALQAIASSSIFTGLGIAATAYFILRYSFSPVTLFRTRALDLYSSYVFFSISARVPTLCMVASALGLMSFLGLVAFDLWPRGVIVVSFLVGVVMSLQFLVFGCHQLGRGVVGGSRRVARASQNIARRLTGVDPPVDVQPPALRVQSRSKITQKAAGM